LKSVRVTENKNKRDLLVGMDIMIDYLKIFYVMKSN